MVIKNSNRNHKKLRQLSQICNGYSVEVWFLLTSIVSRALSKLLH